MPLIPVLMRIRPEQKRDIRTAAREQHCSGSEVVRRALDEYLRKHDLLDEDEDERARRAKE